MISLLTSPALLEHLAIIGSYLWMIGKHPNRNTVHLATLPVCVLTSTCTSKEATVYLWYSLHPKTISKLVHVHPHN